MMLYYTTVDFRKIEVCYGSIAAAVRRPDRRSSPEMCIRDRALTLKGLVSGEDVVVTVPGGTLRVTVNREGTTVKSLWLTGPTNIVCTGEIRDEELTL